MRRFTALRAPATFVQASQDVADAVGIGVAWPVFDVVGAVVEEVADRVAVAVGRHDVRGTRHRLSRRRAPRGSQASA
jgi:hypothetical protein